MGRGAQHTSDCAVRVSAVRRKFLLEWVSARGWVQFSSRDEIGPTLIGTGMKEF